MVKKTLENYKYELDNMKKEKDKEQLPSRKVYLFFSFDVVNSTLYKTINYYGWFHVLTELFRRLQKMAGQYVEGAQLWRVLGDEAIFIVQIKEKNEIFTYMDNIFKLLVDIIEKLKTGDFFKNLDKKFNDREIELMKSQNIISLQAAAWIAIVSDDKENCGKYDNFMHKYQVEPGYEIIEFLGNDIDNGFRVKSLTRDRRLLISFELACILSEKENYLKNLTIITYKKLKGIWQNSLYPIISYHNAVIFDNIAFEDSFYYDEAETNDLIREYLEVRRGGGKIKYLDMYESLEKTFDKIKKDRNLSEKFEQIDKVISESADIIKDNILESSLLELHCACVCYNPENGKILIAQRSNSRKKFPGQWEFGCAKANTDEEMVNTIIREYKQDFNIDIKPVCSEKREDQQPVPVAIYSVKNNRKLHKGVIVLAKVVNDVNIDGFQPTEKHNKIRWISEEELESFDGQAVPDFKETLGAVFQYLQKENTYS